MLTMQEEDFEREVKVVIVGNGCVGKTSMIKQFCKGQYSNEYKKTIGVDFLEKLQYVKALEDEVKLMLWDTAGQEQFHSMTRSYYRGAKVAVLAFSTIDRASFDAIPIWKQKVEEECGSIPMVLVQNKVDLLEDAAVSRQEAEALASDLGLRFYRICVKQNLYVTDVFEYLAEMYLQRDAHCLQTPRISVIGIHRHGFGHLCVHPDSLSASIPQGKPPSMPTLTFPQRIEPEIVDPLYKTCTKVTNIRRHRRGRSRILSDCTIL